MKNPISEINLPEGANMKTFEISYKLYYGETSEWASELIKAPNTKSALKKFSAIKGISKSLPKKQSDWRWKEGVWSAKFHAVGETRQATCPTCGGTGYVAQ